MKTTRPDPNRSRWRALALLATVLTRLALPAPAAEVLIPYGSTWRYLDNGSDQGAAWRQPGYNDDAWNQGRAQLGYGDGDEATVVNGGPAGARFITTYFRRSFQVADAARLTAATLAVIRDDGIVVYLNGTEVFRNNMPAGPISAFTVASSAIAGAQEVTPVVASVPTSALVDGLNVMAVEIHQNQPDSSDISFDLEFTVEGPPPPPQISAQPASQTVIEGYPAHFTVGVIGTEPLWYQWDFNGVPIPDAVEPFLVIPSVAATHAGAYRVVITNLAGSVTSEKAFLQIAPRRLPPVITRVEPLAGPVGSAITITGANFDEDFELNSVRFGSVEAVVIDGNDSMLRALVPAGATYAPLIVTCGGLSARSSLPFNVTFPSGNFLSTSAFSNSTLTTLAAPTLVALSDLNGDGRSELIAASANGGLALHQNLGIRPLASNTFAAPVALPLPSPIHLLVEDLDGDTRADLLSVSAGAPERLVVMRNVGQRTEITSETLATVDEIEVPGAVMTTTGDFDRDGKPDLIVAGNGLTLLRNVAPVSGLAAGSFANTGLLAAGQYYGLHVADLDGDGWLDIAASDPNALQFVVFRNLGAGDELSPASFAPPVGFGTASAGILGLDVADLDGDGRADLALALPGTAQVAAYLNATTAGTFDNSSLEAPVLFPSGGFAFQLSTADLDGDGRPDLTGSTGNPPTVLPLRNTTPAPGSVDFLPPAVLSLPTATVLSRIAIGDLDGDGKPDVVGVHSSDNTMTLMRNVLPPSSAPIIIQPPTDQTAVAGLAVRLEVLAGGSEPLHFQWQREGADVPGATNRTLPFAAVTEADAGRYRVLVSNAFGTTNSPEASLTVISALTDVVDNFDTGVVDPLQWSDVGSGAVVNQIGGFVSAPFSLWFGTATNRHLISRPLDTRTSGLIRFQLRLSDGGDSSWERVDLPFEGVVLEYQLAGMTNWTEVARLDTPDYYTWSQVQLLIPAAAASPATRFRWRQLRFTGETFDHWAIDDVEIRLGPVAPIITRQPRSLAAATGTPGTLAGEVLGTAPLQVQWFRDGAALPDQTNAVLELPPLQPADTGDYHFIAINDHGAVTSLVARLTVYTPPDERFRVLSLTTNEAVTVVHSNFTGFNQGSLAVSPARVFVNGSTAAARFEAADLSGGRALNRRYWGLVTDLKSEVSYALGDGTNALAFSASQINSLVEIDPVSGLPTARRVTLSPPIESRNQSLPVGLYAGYGRVVIVADETVYSVELPSGLVVEFGRLNGVEATLYGGFHGLAEFFDGRLHLVAGVGRRNVQRLRVSDGAREDVATFEDLGFPRGFSASVLSGRWYFNLEGPSQFGEEDGVLGLATAQFEFPDVPRPPVIVGQPQGANVPIGSEAVLTVAATGSRPLAYQWRQGNRVVTNATNASLRIAAMSTALAGNYSVIVSNTYGAVTSAIAPLRAQFLGTQTFRILNLTTRGVYSVPHAPLTGDDRGGIAASSSQLFITGDSSTARLPLVTLAGGSSLSTRYDALTSDLETETVYSLGNGSTPLTQEGGTVNALIELHPETGVPTGRRINVTPAFQVPGGGFSSQVGIFAGYGRVVVHNGTRVYVIVLPSGIATDLGPVPVPARNFSESWAYWGVAEFFDGAIHLVYGSSYFTISRMRVPEGTVTPLLEHFSGAALGDIASLTVSPLNDRWYFHYEGGGFAGSGDEIAGYAEAQFEFNAPPTPPVIIAQPEPATVFEGSGASFRVGARGSKPLGYQWRHEGTDIPGATNATLVFATTTPSNAGNYSVVVTNVYGAVTSSVAALTLRPPLPASKNFRIISLLSDNSRVVDHDALTGDDRGGIAVSATHVFYTGDNQTARFSAADLSGGAAIGDQLDALTGNLRSGTIYTLANGNNPIGFGGGTVNGLIELDGATGTLTTRRIALSQSIAMPEGSGIFAGYDRIVLHNGSRAYAVELPEGEVIDLGAMTTPEHWSCESWAYWGVAEQFNGAIYLVMNRPDFRTIARVRVPDGAVEPIATFDNLSDMCSFSLSVARGRWYFHHEGGSQFGGNVETIGYADARFDRTAPTLSQFDDLLTAEDTPLDLDFRVSDPETPATNIVVTARSSDVAVVAPEGLVITGTGTNRTLRVIPVADASGETTITLTAEDAAGFRTTSFFYLLVTPVNDSPSFAAAGNQVSAEDAGPQRIPGWASAIRPGPADEAAQRLTFLVTPDTSVLFTAPPAVEPDGTLTYTSAPNAHGVATVTVHLRDDGGNDGGGRDTSDPVTFTITITPVCDPMVAVPDATNTPVAVPVIVAVLDNDASLEGHLAVASATPGGHGSVSIAATAVIYTPEAGFRGPDTFTYTATNGCGAAATATVTVLVEGHENVPPVARILVFDACSGAATNVIISPDRSDALVILDGSTSSDDNGDPLTHAWLADLDGDGTAEPLAHGAVTTNLFALGTFAVTLLVDDGTVSTPTTAFLEVVTACEATEAVIRRVGEAPVTRRCKRPLVSTLKAACASFEMGDYFSGVNQLRAFSLKVRLEMLAQDPTAALDAMRCTQAIISTLTCDE